MADRIATQATVIATPIGPVQVTLREGRVVDVAFGKGKSANGHGTNATLSRARRVLANYFRNPRLKLNLPLAPAGTPFQQRVWRALLRIPAGQVRSYGELARRLGTSARAVGGACRANPIPVLIPCHRVVSVGYGDVQGRTSVAGSRKLRAAEGGFMGKTAGRAMNIKRWLLQHERGR